MTLEKLAVVGVGNWGRNLLRNFVDILGENHVVACDADEHRLQVARASFPGLQTSSDFGEILADDAVQAVAIATPAVTHHTLGTQVLEAGKHAFIEKPLALTPTDAQALIDLADQHDRVLMVDHLLEYHPAVERLKAMVDAGELGHLCHLRGERLNLGVVRTEENALWSLAPHDISVVHYLLGEEPLWVRAQGARFLQSDIEDLVYVIMAFPNDIYAHLSLSWLDPQKTRRLTVVGNQAMAAFDDVAAEKLTLFRKRAVGTEGGFAVEDDGATAIELGDGASIEPLRAICQDFLDACRTGGRPRSDGRDGLRVVRVLDAAQRSLDNDGASVECG